MDYVFISVPHFIGKKNPARTETEEIKNSGFVEELRAAWVEIDPDFDAYDDPVVAVNVALAEALASNTDRFPIILAADCVSSIGAVKGLRAHHDDLAVIWYDAHGDFNTPETTPSNFLGGMPLAALVGRGNAHLLEGVGLQAVPESRIYVADVRDLDPEEGEMLRNSEIHILDSAADFLKLDLPEVPLYIHLDVDILDPEFMPGLGYPADNGATPPEVNSTLRRIGLDGNVAALLVSLYNAEIATDSHRALTVTVEMMRALVNAMEEKR
jgi:arginase